MQRSIFLWMAEAHTARKRGQVSWNVVMYLLERVTPSRVLRLDIIPITVCMLPKQAPQRSVEATEEQSQ